MKKSRWRRIRRILTGLVIAYLGACVVLYFIQNLLIFPGAYFHGAAAAQVTSAPDRELVHLRLANGQTVAAIFGTALDSNGAPLPDPRHQPTILFFYGNGDCIQTSLGVFEEFRRLGANVMVPEYPGYPMSGGKPSEAGMYAAADASYDWLLARPDIDPGKIVVIGRSLGGAAAIDLASRRRVAGLVTLAAFTSMDAMARKVLPIFPTQLFLSSHFDNSDRIANVKCPILMGHGSVDSLVPYRMMSELAAGAKAPVTTFPIRGANHNDIFDVGGREIMSRVGEFLRSLQTGASSPAR